MASNTVVAASKGSLGEVGFYSNLMKMLNCYNISFNFKHDTFANWKHSLCNLQKLEFYNTFKDSYTPSPYLDLNRKNPNRKTLVKLKIRTISNHKLLIETGRYNNISRSDRLCTICGHNVEDETHFQFHCPRYSYSIRDKNALFTIQLQYYLNYRTTWLLT